MAQEEIRRRTAFEKLPIKPALFGNPDQRSLRIKRLWYRMPLYIRPFFYFFYRYFLRLGFLDGREGFVFHFMQGFWFRMMVDIHIDQLRRGKSNVEGLGVSKLHSS